MYQIEDIKDTILCGDSLTELRKIPDESIDSIITSPPYWALRDYGVAGQLGLESTFQEYISKLCDIFDEVKRVLKPEGTCWVNLGDTYSAQRWTGNGQGQPMNGFKDGHRDIAPMKITGMPDKSLVQIPSRFAIEMSNRGWILRNEIIWHKPNCMPSSVKDRFTVDFEKVFFFVKSKKYWFDSDSVKEPTLTKDNSSRDRDTTKLNNCPGRTRMAGLKVNNYDFKNKRAVWTVTTKPFTEAHFATFPEALIETPIKAGCPAGGVCLDPFMGAGTTAVVAKKLGRHYLGIELNPAYIEIAETRIGHVPISLFANQPVL